MTNLLPRLQATLGDDYVVERELAGDGAAHLFVARERTLNRALMIKVLSAEQTTTRVANGTPAYTSPEQVSADAEVDQRADIYACGCVAYEIFAGAPPFVRDSTEQVLSAHLNDDPVPISLKRRDLPATLVKVIMRCLAKDPANRPRYADNLFQLLEGLDAAPDRLLTPPYAPAVSDEPSLSQAETTATPRPGAQLDKRCVVGLVGAVAGALAVAYALMHRTPAPRAELATPVAVIVVVERSVAVLPFTTPSKVAQDQLFSAAISDEIARTLSRMGVHVIGRSSAAAFVALGDVDSAIGLLGTALQRHDVPLALFSRSPRYRVVRADPRAEALLAGLKR